MNTATPGSLLIVDDELGITSILSKVLKKYVTEIHTANHAKDALALLKAGDFDAVLSDINMPEMSGLDLLAQVRHMGMETPFVFLTGYADKEKAYEALRLGATDFLEKPFQPEVITDVILKAVALGQAIKAAEAEVERLFTDQKIPADYRIKLRKMKLSILMMRTSFSIYKK